MAWTEAQKRATKKYLTTQYRPSIYIDKSRQETIEQHFKNKGFKSFNEYVNWLIDIDMNEK